MPYTAEYATTFNASHVVPQIFETPHSHTWVFKLKLQAETLSDQGIILDYFKLVEMVKAVLPQNGSHLNQALPVAPTAECLARYFYEQLKPQLPQLLTVGVGEFETFICWYQP